MASLAVKLPITKDSGDGFVMIKDFKTLVKQNLKMLLLTHPGERVMEPSFGIGIQRFLFENFNNNTFQRIEDAIMEQVAIYLPVLTIKEINFITDDADANRLQVKIKYAIPSLNVRDLLEFTI
tara:strand:- start:1644 stop:2012 length:369 start_codon:yes stop_codon:yes gene_type:complete